MVYNTHELPGTAKHDPLAYLQNRTVDWLDHQLAARELLYVGFEKLGIPYIKRQGNFVLFAAGDRAVEIRDTLREKGILVRDRSYELPGCVRVTVGTREQMRKFLTELEAVWKRPAK